MAAIAEIEDAIKNKGMAGISLDPYLAHLPPSEARFYPVYSKYCELSVPVIITMAPPMDVPGAVLEYSRPADQTPIGKWFVWHMGLASGLLMGGVGMGGAPLVLYIFLRRFSKDAGISSLNAASLGIMLCLLPWQYQAGMFPPDVLKSGLLGGAAGIAGVIVCTVC